ncbi:site-specific integrase [Pseudomonas sp. MAP12]|uniref:Site-specific integrase n=1 Tax=Geopseudomonas aromaticivorans TaxID=2849492 RepID=A0ABS6MY79_9GAMM|nr:site-specific integrase [Pseudomonas aromaticivorans]MBV2133286.1 site-specific integrase [Pseudomonas aromaticivorans]
MNEATKASYKNLAEHFYSRRLAGQRLTPKAITDALIAAAPEYRPAYWRRLRNAIEFDQLDKGYSDAAERIAKVRNPVTKEDSGLKPKAKQVRVRAVKEEDELRLLDYFAKVGDYQCMSAVVVTKYTGARPVELEAMRVEDGKVFIKSGKKSHGGWRGLDRVLVLTEEDAKLVAESLKTLQYVNIGAIQDRVSAAGRRLWPQRRAVPSLYSWRHQLGSDLKASGLCRQEVAWIMGHQSTESIEQYGNRKTARSGAVLPRAPEGADLSLVRERHSVGPLASRAAHDSLGVNEELGMGGQYDGLGHRP